MRCHYEGTGVFEGLCLGTKEFDSCIGPGRCTAFKAEYKTNADRIRAMSDEELAEFITVAQERCDYCQLSYIEGACTETLCEDAMLKWLKQPVKDGEN